VDRAEDQPIFTETHEIDRGFRLHRGQVSILTKMLAWAKPLTEKERFDLARITRNFHDDVAGVPKTPPDFRQTMTADEFPERNPKKLYRFTSREVWEKHLSRGDFQLGTLAFYRATENLKIRDQREGYAHLAICWPHKEMHCSVEAGANCVVLCCTRRAVSARMLMSERFGDMLIEINDPVSFSSRVSEKIGAARVNIRDVVYSDPKTFRVETNFKTDPEILRDDTLEGLHSFNRQMFQVLYDAALLPSLFSKPKEFSVEQERRVAFELPYDVPGDFIRISDPGLLDHIRVVR
jgi:hypothetical protein